MKVNVETLSNTERKLDVFLQPELVKEKLEEVFKEFQKNAKVRGFRPGKVPRRVIESIYGKQIFDEVSSRLVSDSFPEALQEASVTPVSRPNLTTDKVETDKEFHYSAVFEIIPDFEVDDYIGIELKKEKIEVKEDEVSMVLDRLRNRSAEAKPIEAERGAAKGDLVIIDYEGTLEGRSLEDLKKSDVQFVIGEGQLIPEFEDAIIGLRKGEVRKFDVSYGEDFQIREAAGKTVNFELRLKDILERILPDLDDEFAKDLGEEDLESLRKKILDDLEKRHQVDFDNKLKTDLINKLIENKTFDIPNSLVEEESMRLKREFGFNLQRQGLRVPRLDERAEKSITERAVRNVKASIVLGAIAKKEGIDVTSGEVDKRLSEISKSFDVPYEKVREAYQSNSMLEGLHASILEEKAIDFLIEKAKIEEVLGQDNQIDNKS
jgi:trigger factor